MKPWKKGAIFGGVWSFIGFWSFLIIPNYFNNYPILAYFVALPIFAMEFLIKNIYHDGSIFPIIFYGFLVAWIPITILGMLLGSIIGLIYERERISFVTSIIGFYLGVLSIRFWSFTRDAAIVLTIFSIPVMTYIGYRIGKRLSYQSDSK